MTTEDRYIVKLLLDVAFQDTREVQCKNKALVYHCLLGQLNLEVKSKYLCKKKIESTLKTFA